jgi:hypothetical protein
MFPERRVANVNQAQEFLQTLYGSLEEGEFIDVRLVGAEQRRVFRRDAASRGHPAERAVDLVGAFGQRAPFHHPLDKSANTGLNAM